MEQISRKLSPKSFINLRAHNIKKRYNIWEENLDTGEIQSSHLIHCNSLKEAIKKVDEFQELADKMSHIRYLYHLDVEILIVDSSNKSLMEDGDIAYSITVYPDLKETDNVQVI